MHHSLAFCALPFLLASVCVAADTAEFYIGTNTKPGGSRGIHRGTLDLRTGALSAPVLVGEAQKPGFLAVHPDGKFLYAVMESGGGAVGAFAIGKDGPLRRLNVESTKGPGATHLAVHPGGKSVLAAGGAGEEGFDGEELQARAFLPAGAFAEPGGEGFGAHGLGRPGEGEEEADLGLVAGDGAAAVICRETARAH